MTDLYSSIFLLYECNFLEDFPYFSESKLRYKLQIREGPHGRVLGDFSEFGAVPILAGKQFWVKFKTGELGNARGFKLHWSRKIIVPLCNYVSYDNKRSS